MNRAAAHHQRADEVIRVEARVTGVVEGVGFRPFVHVIATELNLAGEVGNDDGGVFVSIEGPRYAVMELLRSIADEAPPPARVDAVTSEQVPTQGSTRFRIVASRHDPARLPTPIPPDTATCLDCLSELSDPHDRRYRYPFITCSRCGPRFTLITGLPYDRPRTTMDRFQLCSACAAEYEDSADRRFHAQATCCPACGPRLRFFPGTRPPAGSGEGDELEGEAALEATLAELAAGRIVAIKGVGGYHLACDPLVPGAVARLRRRKHRSAKPLALMVRDEAVARRFVHLDEHATRSLASPAAPIVLAPIVHDREVAVVAADVAPGLDDLGVLLPYTALHHLLMQRFDILVMTSGNLADEPLAIDPDQAHERLAGIADAWLDHDRPIAVACDDSVLRVHDGAVRPVRLGRGYAPVVHRLPMPAPAPLLAVGGELKATVCVAQGTRAWLSAHVGDVASLDTLVHLERTAEALTSLSRITPELLVADAHPGYLTHHWAKQRAAATGAGLNLVQHHHAHVASLLVEHGIIDEPVLGIAFDGTGYGSDSTIWGGEFLLGGITSVERVGHLTPISLPGGDAAIRRPARSALAHLAAAGIGWEEGLPPVDDADDQERRVVGRMLQTGTGCVPTSSVGRLFDAIASLAGVRQDASYEAQAAMELEAMAAAAGEGPSGWRIDIDGDGPLVLDPSPLMRASVAAVLAGESPGRVGWSFHAALSDAVVEAAIRLRRTYGVTRVGLTGGVFLNRLLSRLCAQRLTAQGFVVLQHERVPANDGGLALGQAAVAAAGGGF